MIHFIYSDSFMGIHHIVTLLTLLEKKTLLLLVILGIVVGVGGRNAVGVGIPRQLCWCLYRHGCCRFVLLESSLFAVGLFCGCLPLVLLLVVC